MYYIHADKLEQRRGSMTLLTLSYSEFNKKKQVKVTYLSCVQINYLHVLTCITYKVFHKTYQLNKPCGT